jgi:hypothetical protein
MVAPGFFSIKDDHYDGCKCESGKLPILLFCFYRYDPELTYFSWSGEGFYVNIPVGDTRPW